MIKTTLSLFLLLINMYAIELSTKTEDTASLKDDPLFHIHVDNGLSLYQAILYSVQFNPKIDASKQRVYQASQSIEEAFAGHLPTLDMSGNAGYEARTLTPDDAVVVAPQTTRFHYKKTELYVNIKENIWAGGSIENRVDEQRQKLASIMFDHQANLEKVTIEMIQTYFDVVYGKIALKVNQKNMQDFTKVLDIMKIKEANGAATKGDLNFIKANVDNAQTELIRTQTTLSNALSFYTYLLGEQYAHILPFEDSVPLQHTDLNTSLDKARTNNSKIQRQMASIQATQYGLNAQKGTYHPTVDLLINGESRDEFDIGTGQRDKGSVLLSFQYNLYNGGKDEAKTLRLYSKMKEYKYTLADERRKIGFQTKVLHQSVSALNQSIKLTENEVISARKVVNSYWIAFKEGTQDLQALQLALRSLNRAELDYVNFQKNLYVDNLKLMQNTGELLDYLDIHYNKDAQSYNEMPSNAWEEY